MKIQVITFVLIFQRSLSNTEDECQHLRTMCETSQKELQELAEKHQQQLQDMLELNEKLKVKISINFIYLISQQIWANHQQL